MTVEQALMVALIAAVAGGIAGFLGNLAMQLIVRSWASRDADRQKIAANEAVIGDLQRSLLKAQLELEALSGFADVQTTMAQTRRASRGPR